MAARVGGIFVDVKVDSSQAAAALQRDMTAAATKASKAVETSMAAGLRNTATTMTRMGRQISFGLSLPIGAVEKQSEALFLGFETGMTKVGALTGQSVEQTKEWEDSVRGLAKTYGQSTEDLSKGLYLIASSGQTGTQAIETLDAAAKGAAIGLGSVETMSGLVTAAMNAYGPSNLSAAQAVDVLTGAVQQSKFRADEMAGALSNLLPFSSQLNVSFADLTGTMSALSMTGTDAAMASTQLRQIFATLLDPSTQATKALEGVNLSASELRESLADKGIIATLLKMDDALSKGGDRVEQFSAVFGNIRALTGVFNLTGQQVENLRRILDNTTNSAGKANAALERMKSTRQFQLNQAFENLKDTLIDLGAAVAPIVQKFVEFGATVASVFRLFPDWVKSGIGALGLLVTALGPALYSLGSMVDVVALFAQGWEGIKARATATRDLAGATTELSATMKEFLASVTEATAANEALATSVTEVGAATESETGAVSGLSVAMQEALASITEVTAANEALAASNGQVAASAEAAGAAQATKSMGTTASTGLTAAEKATENVANNSGKAAGFFSSIGASAAGLAGAMAPVLAILVSIGLVVKRVQEWSEVLGHTVSDIEKSSLLKIGQGGGLAGAAAQQQQIKAAAAIARDNPWWDLFASGKGNEIAEKLDQQNEAIAKNAQMATLMAAATRENADSLYDWLAKQQAAGTTYKDVNEALKAYTASEKEHGRTVSTAATLTGRLIEKSKEMFDIYDKERSAVRGLEDAQAKVAEADQRAKDAITAQTEAVARHNAAVNHTNQQWRDYNDALAKVTEAQKKATDAQNELNEALKGPSKAERLDVREAQLNLRQAQKRLREAGSPEDRMGAQIAAERARMALQEARGAHSKRVDELTKARDEANKGLQDAIQARDDALIAANKEVTDSEKAVRDANKEVTDSARDARRAHEDIVPAAMGAATAHDAVAEAVEKAGGHLDGMKQTLGILKDLYPQLAGEIETALRRIRDAEDKYASTPPSQRQMEDQWRQAHPKFVGPPTPEQVTDWYMADAWQKAHPGTMGPPTPEEIRDWWNKKYHRAMGGSVFPRNLYEVNERGPELFSAGSHQFLIPLQAGRVDPLLPSNMPIKGGDGPMVSTGDIIIQTNNPEAGVAQIRRELRKVAFLRAGR